MVCRAGGGERWRVGHPSGVDLLNYLRLTENAGVRGGGVGLRSQGREKRERGGEGNEGVVEVAATLLSLVFVPLKKLQAG